MNSRYYEQKNPRTFILTASRPYTSLGRFALDLKAALGDTSTLVLLNMDSGAQTTEKIDNADITSNGNGAFSGNWFNLLFSNAVHHSIISKLRRETELGSLIHISSHTFYFPLLTDRTVVTIFDTLPLKKISKNAYSIRFRLFMYATLARYTQYPYIMVPSKHVKNDLLQYFDVRGNIEVIPLPVSPSFFRIRDKTTLRKTLNLPQDKFLVLSISSNEPRKNLSTVSRVMEKLGNEFKLVRVGSEIENAINFDKILNPILLNYIYNACDVLLFPTLEEGFGYPIIESFATGLPVVSSNIPVIKEVAEDAAVLSGPLDVSALSESVRVAIDDHDLYEKKGYQRSLDFSLDRFKARILDFYSKI